MRLIVENSGFEGSVVLNTVKQQADDYGFDADIGEYGPMLERGIVDPTKVTRSALQNAASVASMVLTTESMIAEIPQEKPPMPAIAPRRRNGLLDPSRSRLGWGAACRAPNFFVQLRRPRRPQGEWSGYFTPPARQLLKCRGGKRLSGSP